MKKIFSIIKYEFSETIRRPKNLLVLFFIIVLYESTLSPMKSVCGETGLALNIFEPFILICTRSLNIILIPLIFIILISDFPNCKTDYFRMIRLSKREWLIGEIAFLCLISLLMLVVLIIGTMLPMISVTECSNDWSGFMTSLRENFTEIYYHNIRFTLEANIITHSLPISALVYSLLIMWLNLMIYGLLILLGNLASKRMALLVSALSLAFLGGCSTLFDSKIKWVFPITHTQLGQHFNSIFSKIKFPVYMSYVYLAAAVAVITVICRQLLKTTVFEENSL